jgi:hypothetical protein
LGKVALSLKKLALSCFAVGEVAGEVAEKQLDLCSGQEPDLLGLEGHGQIARRQRLADWKVDWIAD